MLLFVSCATSTREISQYYKPQVPFKQKPINPSSIRVQNVPYKFDKAIIAETIDQGYLCLGIAEFKGPLLTPAQLREFGGSVGGDLLWYETKHIGTQRGSRMVLGSYTPPTVGYSTATASGYSSGSAYANAQTPWGPVSVNSSGYGSSYGTATATTYNPGQSTYVRQEFEYPVYEHGIAVWQSPQGQIRNWDNVEKELKIFFSEFSLDYFKATYKSRYKTLSPPKKALADALESGKKFDELTARQFIFQQYNIDEQRKKFEKSKQ